LLLRFFYLRILPEPEEFWHFLSIARSLEATGGKRVQGPGQTRNVWRPNQTLFGEQTFYHLDALFGAV